MTTNHTTTTDVSPGNTDRVVRSHRLLKLVAAAALLASVVSAVTVLGSNEEAEASSLCPTVVPGFGCDVVWDSNSSFVGDTWSWLNDYYYGDGSLSNDSNEVISMRSQDDSRNHGCVRSFDVPGLSWMQVTDGSGNVYHLKRDSYNYSPTVHVWINGVNEGEFYAENASFGDVHVLFEMRTELVTWMGSVQYETKPVMYVVACNGSLIY